MRAYSIGFPLRGGGERESVNEGGEKFWDERDAY